MIKDVIMRESRGAPSPFSELQGSGTTTAVFDNQLIENVLATRNSSDGLLSLLIGQNGTIGQLTKVSLNVGELRVR
jgi:hypothetical protein